MKEKSISKTIIYYLIILLLVPALYSKKLEISGDIDFSYTNLYANYDLAGESLDKFYYETIVNMELKTSPVDYFYSTRINTFDSLGDDQNGVRILPYRYWARYTGKKSEIRLGLQKMVFGPGKILRPLALFDSIDPSDSSKKTGGQKALRFSYFPDTETTLQTWVIKNDAESSKIHYGGRYNSVIKRGEASLVYQHWENDFLHVKEDIIGCDLFLDITIGFWIEHASHLVDGTANYNLSTLGIDYTFQSIGNGLHIGIEHMINTDSGFEVQDSYTSLFWDIPLNDSRSIYGIGIYAEKSHTTGVIIQMRENVNDRLDAEIGFNWVNKLPDFASLASGSPFLLDRRVTFRLVYSF
ncbi:hypothetical protein KAJ27_22425 [bacterium]|nr:hypothetical protein [bacterium]